MTARIAAVLVDYFWGKKLLQVWSESLEVTGSVSPGYIVQAY